MFNDYLIRRQGLEYEVVLPNGHVVYYLSRETAEVYRDTQGAKILAPMQGPQMPECFKVLHDIPTPPMGNEAR